MEIIFTEFIFAYLLAECHKKVATIIFYFARAVSPAISHCNLNTVAGKLTTPEAGTRKVGGKKRISGRIRTLTLRAILGAKKIF